MKFGRAFSDNVTVEGARRGLFSTAKPFWWYGAGRPLLFTSLTVVVFFVLAWRLFSLTIIKGHTYRLLSDTNRTKQLVRHAARGDLLDRTGKPLAFNSPYIRILHPCEGATEKLCMRKASMEEGEAIRKTGLPSGWYTEEDYGRRYSDAESLFHVIGYVGEVSDAELKDDYYQLRGYRMGDMLGRAGAEAVFEEELRGKDGREFAEVDSQGKIIRILGQTPAVQGTSVTLSVDKGLVQAVSTAFPKGEKGAVVVTKPATGEILALYSSPSFSSETFSRGLSAREFGNLTDNPDLPLFNRAIGGAYPPGSTFKLITATAALEEKAVKKETVVEDTGEIKIGAFTFPNWYFKQYGKTEGMVDIVKALRRSNDIFFYKAGEWLGITKLGNWARKMGAGTLLGVELPGEATGLMPDPSWKDAAFHSDDDIAARNNEWYLGDTYHVAIGQGYLLTTPLQVNVWTNVIANGGRLCRPTIRKTGDNKHATENCKDLGIKKETIALITEGMRQACEPGGTGWPLFNFGIRKKMLDDGTIIATTSGTLTKIPVACKTGTAEYGDPKNKTHAWFTVFAPSPKDFGDLQPQGRALEANISGEPEISVTVLIEGAGEGSDKAAPVAKKILEEWFSR